MTEEKKSEKKQQMYYCEVCRCKVSDVDAEKTDYLHCGRKMTPMEAAYMSSPSPTGV